MRYEHFVGTVQNLAGLQESDAINAIRATLETLSERLAGDEADHLASQLPREIGVFLKIPPERGGERFSIEEFFDRVARREGKEVKDVVRNVRAVAEVLKDSVSPQELDDMYAQLPHEFRQLFDGHQ